MKKGNKVIYEIYINNEQFSCIYEDIKNEKNIPNILGIPNLNCINKEINANATKLYY